jgi:hypothetical protein
LRQLKELSMWYNFAKKLKGWTHHVAVAGINPLLKRVLKGAANSRPSPLPPEVWYAKRISQWAAAADHSPPMTADALAAALQPLRESGRLIISVSHEDIRHRVGGVQSVISAEQRAAQALGWHYLHIAPAAPLPMLSKQVSAAAFRAALRLDDGALGIARFKDLLAVTADLRRNGVRLDSVVHHLMGHSPELIMQLVQASGTEEPIVWTHDFFTICPSFALLANDLAFCGAPEIEAPECRACCYHTERKDHRNRMRAFFEATQPIVAAPSKVALDFWLARTHLPHSETLVAPPGHLSLSEPLEDRSDLDRPLRIAHLGARAFHKGWHVFERLSAKFANDPRYTFLHLGVPEMEPNGAVKSALPNIPVRVTAETPNAMVEAVTEAGVDVVVMWPLWYETFNITTHEALAGGAFVVVREAAGNCWPAVYANAPEQGCAVADEAALFRLFETDALSAQVRNASRRRGTFTRSPGSTGRLRSGAG